MGTGNWCSLIHVWSSVHLAQSCDSGSRVHKDEVVWRDVTQYGGIDPFLTVGGANQCFTGRVGGCKYDFAEPSLVTTGHADIVGAVVTAGFQQPGVFEADMSEFPKQVVQQHEPPGG